MGPSGFVCGLGSMGRKHLAALLGAGFHVTGLDPDSDAREAALELADNLGRAGCFEAVSCFPSRSFDVATFAEPAPFRVDNVRRLAASGGAARILLEKPVATDSSALEALRQLALGLDDVRVHLPLRAWNDFLELRQRCKESRRLTITVNGGAKGLGCNGVHYADLLFFLSGENEALIEHVRLGPETLASPRAGGYHDYGGTLFARNGKGMLFLELDAASSAAPWLTVRGDHFVATFDESDWSTFQSVRSESSALPAAMYARDYGPRSSRPVRRVSPEALISRWALGDRSLPTLEDALPAHRLILDGLARGGAAGPHYFP